MTQSTKRDRELAVALRLRNSFFQAYHRALRHFLNCPCRGGCCELAMDVVDLYEARYQALDRKIDLLANPGTIINRWRRRRGRWFYRLDCGGAR